MANEAKMINIMDSQSAILERMEKSDESTKAQAVAIKETQDAFRTSQTENVSSLKEVVETLKGRDGAATIIQGRLLDRLERLEGKSSDDDGRPADPYRNSGSGHSKPDYQPVKIIEKLALEFANQNCYDPVNAVDHNLHCFLQNFTNPNVKSVLLSPSFDVHQFGPLGLLTWKELQDGLIDFKGRHVNWSTRQLDMDAMHPNHEVGKLLRVVHGVETYETDDGRRDYAITAGSAGLFKAAPTSFFDSAAITATGDVIPGEVASEGSMYKAFRIALWERIKKDHGLKKTVLYRDEKANGVMIADDEASNFTSAVGVLGKGEWKSLDMFTFQLFHRYMSQQSLHLADLPVMADFDAILLLLAESPCACYEGVLALRRYYPSADKEQLASLSTQLRGWQVNLDYYLSDQLGYRLRILGEIAKVMGADDFARLYPADPDTRTVIELVTLALEERYNMSSSMDDLARDYKRAFRQHAHAEDEGSKKLVFTSVSQMVQLFNRLEAPGRLAGVRRTPPAGTMEVQLPGRPNPGAVLVNANRIDDADDDFEDARDDESVSALVHESGTRAGSFKNAYKGGSGLGTKGSYFEDRSPTGRSGHSNGGSGIPAPGSHAPDKQKYRFLGDKASFSISKGPSNDSRGGFKSESTRGRTAGRTAGRNDDRHRQPASVDKMVAATAQRLRGANTSQDAVAPRRESRGATPTRGVTFSSKQLPMLYRKMKALKAVLGDAHPDVGQAAEIVNELLLHGVDGDDFEEDVVELNDVEEEIVLHTFESLMERPEEVCYLTSQDIVKCLMHFQSEVDVHANAPAVFTLECVVDEVALSDLTMRSMSLLIHFDTHGNFLYVTYTDSCATRSLDNVLAHYIPESVKRLAKPVTIKMGKGTTLAEHEGVKEEIIVDAQRPDQLLVVTYPSLIPTFDAPLSILSTIGLQTQGGGFHAPPSSTENYIYGNNSTDAVPQQLYEFANKGMRAAILPQCKNSKLPCLRVLSAASAKASGLPLVGFFTGLP